MTRKAGPTPSDDRLIRPFIHQEQIVKAPHLFPEYDWFILAGGYGCGKSFSIVLCILDIANRYQGHDISVGIGSTTITKAIKSIIKDLRVILKKSHSSFDFNKKDNILTIGTVQFFLIATEQPGDIYAYNLHIFLCDEIDELPQAKVLDAATAIRERTRLTLPDGRIPYMMFFTTVQGYRGLYQLVQNLKGAGEKYVMVRGLTKNNTSLSASYVKSLYAIYDDNERLAYLEGRFVNLRAGRVYPDFDEATCVVDDFDSEPADYINIGQDLNAGFSKGVAIIKRGDVLYVHRTWSFQEIGNAPQVMRQTYPPNEIYWFPDASGKEIIKGYRSEVAAAGINLRIGISNPSIVDRIFYVNKLFKTGRLKICRKGGSAMTEALKTRQFNDLGVPEKGAGENAPDHICFAAGTLVATDKGWRPIEDIRPGELVLTPEGYRAVGGSGKTGRSKVIYRAGLVATPDHPIKTDRGYEPLDKAQHCYAITWEDAEWQRLLYITESSIGAIQRLQDGPTGTTSLQELLTEWRGVLRTFTETCGSMLTDQYQRALLFTIRTAIQAIMTSTTSSLSQELRMLKCTIKTERIGHLQKMIARKLLNGTEVKPAMSGTPGPAEPMREDARFVGQYISQKAMRERTGQDESSAPGTAHKFITTAKEQDVYNLSVNGSHTFFANGVLVHNCDALEYVTYRLVMADSSFRNLRQLSREAVKKDGYRKTE